MSAYCYISAGQAVTLKVMCAHGCVSVSVSVSLCVCDRSDDNDSCVQFQQGTKCTRRQCLDAIKQSWYADRFGVSLADCKVCAVRCGGINVRECVLRRNLLTFSGLLYVCVGQSLYFACTLD